MTATAVGSAPRRTTTPPTPTAAEVVLLQAVDAYPAVSILCSAEPAPVMPRAVVSRLRALVTEATERVRGELGVAAAQSLGHRLEALADDLTRRPTRGAVAIYVSADHESVWALPLAVVDRAVVDPTFATRDLVRTLHRTPRHVVLLLTEREARLLDGIGDVLLPAAVGPFPVVAKGHRPAGRPDRSRQNRGTADDQDEDFLRTVDRALSTYLTLHPAPLVLVGAEPTVARFRRLSRNLGRLAGTVRGSHARTNLPELRTRIRPVIEAYLQSRQDEALALLEQRAGARQIVSGMPAVWLAARADRPEMLAVEQGLFYPARVSRDGDFLVPATDVDHPDVVDDVVDEVIELVLRRGGWVAMIEDGRLAGHDGIALSLRKR